MQRAIAYLTYWHVVSTYLFPDIIERSDPLCMCVVYSLPRSAVHRYVR